MDFLELNAKLRDKKGTGHAKALRRANRIPGILYGPGTEPVQISIDNLELETTIKKSKIEQVLVSILLTDKDNEKRPAMLKELQVDPVTRKYFHVDFYQIDLDRKIRIFVPVQITGKSQGVEFGGILQVIRRDLEIYCLPADIPDSIEIDITELDIGDSVHVEDIPLAENVSAIYDVNFTVVTVLSPTTAEKDEEEEEEEEEMAEAATEEAVAE